MIIFLFSLFLSPKIFLIDDNMDEIAPKDTDIQTNAVQHKMGAMQPHSFPFLFFFLFVWDLGLNEEN